jgi:glutamine amidotransferase
LIKTGGLYSGLSSPSAFYFVHSYALVPEDRDVVSGICDHGAKFAASIEKDNIFATQFHPEKSHKEGLAVLRNFINVQG